ncbi:Protein NRT1/ PTR FAMILY 5.1 [Rhynchospora pubera]|uniref:Protein NRT1/ PTR FAMILY 5.1 n=1 Tax=Rhynchospora pubera TaxID=906938 RepID=A0AAV8GRN4_9POAL|nr:Protein NRT1/ PTR FAMILY 5.1 [Rhynchospora pubera]
MENIGYTQDGSVDLRGRPVVAAETGRWKACGFLVGYEAFERMAFYGVAANLVVYLTTELQEATVSSVRNVTTWSGSVWMTPIIGAYIADTYLGRFWTFTISSLIYVLGMVLLTAAVSFKPFHPKCTATSGSLCPTSSKEVAFFYISLYIMAIGAGGTKPNISTFGADQFDDYDPYERKLKTSFFNWWMFSSFIGGLMATLGLVYVQENVGWGLGYGIPTAGLMLSLLLFYIGTPFYRHKVKKAESPMKEISKVIKTALENRQYKVSGDSKVLYELERQQYLTTAKRQLQHCSSFKFLDKAALKESTNPCTVTEVETTKLFLGMFLVWLTTIVPTTIFAQVNTLFVKQGTTLERTIGHSFQIPAASLGSFITISMLISVPIYDKYFVPFMRRRTGNPRGITLLQRLGIGFFSVIFVMIVAYFVELKRMHVITRYGIKGPKETVPMSIFWLLPQYVLLGVCDVFSAIGLLEFFYEQSPEGMQSLGTTFFTSGIGIGNFMNSLLVTAVDKITRRGGGKSWIGDNLNDSHLDYYYAFLLVLVSVNFGAFIWISKRYKYKSEVAVGVAENGAVQMEDKFGDAHPNDSYLGEKL